MEAFTRGCWALGPSSLAGGTGLPYRKVSAQQICGGRGGVWTLWRPSLEAAKPWDPSFLAGPPLQEGFNSVYGGGVRRHSFEDAGLWDDLPYGKVSVPLMLSEKPLFEAAGLWDCPP
jgi:hypothetical protein